MRFPPMALLTLVENAIRHGIDPSLSGGRIEVGGRRIDAQTVQLWVADTGVGCRSGRAPAPAWPTCKAPAGLLQRRGWRATERAAAARAARRDAAAGRGMMQGMAEPTALIADDEPLLRDRLARCWPRRGRS
jgi:hypothetical protein